MCQVDNLNNAGLGGLGGCFAGGGGIIFGLGGGPGMVVMKYFADYSYESTSHLPHMHNW